jgi:hypothetical protein
MSDPSPSTFTGGRRIHVRGHEIVVHTARMTSSKHLCFVFLTDPFDERHELRIFKGRGATPEAAETTTLKEALDYLDRPVGGGGSSILAGRSTLDIAGRKVDIFCDLVADGKYQAFPFLYRPDGTRVLILRFHLKESITGSTPAEAMLACIRRLEDHFRRGDPDRA